MMRQRIVALAVAMFVLVSACCCCCGGGDWDDWDDWENWEDWNISLLASLGVEASAYVSTVPLFAPVSPQTPFIRWQVLGVGLLFWPA
jgi:hypothetical protein